MHWNSFFLRNLQAASALSRSNPAKRARYSVLSPLVTVSVVGAALLSTSLALLCAEVSLSRASPSASKAPIWIAQPPRPARRSGAPSSGAAFGAAGADAARMVGASWDGVAMLRVGSAAGSTGSVGVVGMVDTTCVLAGGGAVSLGAETGTTSGDFV